MLLNAKQVLESLCADIEDIPFQSKKKEGEESFMSHPKETEI